MTSVGLDGDAIVIHREAQGQKESIRLSFVEVATASEILREHLLQLTPEELPPLPEGTKE